MKNRLKFFYKDSLFAFNAFILKIIFFVLKLLFLICASTSYTTAIEVAYSGVKDKFLKTSYTVEKGLPQNTVNSQIQTKDGYIWMATFAGLVRFDGLKFTVFTSSNTPQLINNRLKTLYEDTYGTLWIGSVDGDIFCYNQGVFSVVKESTSQTEGVISSFYLDDKNNLWIGSNNGLKTYNLYTKEFQAIDSKLLLKKGNRIQRNLSIKSISKSSDGSLWMISNYGLIKFKNGEFTNLIDPQKLITDLSYLIIDKQDNLWISTKNGIIKFSEGVFSNPHHINSEIEYPDSLYDGSPIIVDNKTIYEVKNDVIKTHDISSLIQNWNWVVSILIDKEGNLWIGTAQELVKLTKRHINYFAVSQSRLDLLSTTSIVEDMSNSVWIASHTNLLLWKEGKFRIKHTFDSQITSLATDKKDELWVGTEKQIFRYKDNHFVAFNNHILEGRAYFRIFFDKENNLWVGSEDGGLVVFEKDHARSFTTANGLVNNAVFNMFQTNNGVIWIGTAGGLSRLEKGVFTNYTKENGLTNNLIRDIYEDEDNNLWFGSYGGGLTRFKDGKFSSITSENGLSEDIVSRILIDDNDNFWIMGNKGIYSVSRKLLNDYADGKTSRIYCTEYRSDDGMLSAEGNGVRQPAGWKTRDGRLWFPMVKGGIILDPKTIQTKNNTSVYIENVLIDKLQPKIANNSFKIDYDQNNLEITYTGINFTNPEQLKFRYKLVGFDRDWQEAGTRRTAYYSNIPPGKYTFKVNVVNYGSFISNEGAGIEIEILTPFWQTWWFSFLTLIVLTIFSILWLQIRLQKANKRRIEQENFTKHLLNTQESERYRIAGELHDSIGQRLAIIKNTALLGKETAKDLDATQHFTNIVSHSVQSITEVREITYNLRPYLIEKLGLNIALETLFDQIRSTRTIDIYSEIDNLTGLFLKEDEINIYRIIQECLNNILKHSDGSQAIINIKIQDSFVLIEIKDDGKGFDQNLLEEKNKKPGFGFWGISERVFFLGGKFTVKSKESQGTTILIHLKLKKL